MKQNFVLFVIFLMSSIGISTSSYALGENPTLPTPPNVDRGFGRLSCLFSYVVSQGSKTEILSIENYLDETGDAPAYKIPGLEPRGMANDTVIDYVASVENENGMSVASVYVGFLSEKSTYATVRGIVTKTIPITLYLPNKSGITPKGEPFKGATVNCILKD